MMQILQSLVIIALLVCGSRKLGARAFNAGQTNRKPVSPLSGYSTGMGPYEIDVKVLRLCEDPGTHVNKYHLEPYATKVDGVTKILYRAELTQPWPEKEYTSLLLSVVIYRQRDHKEFLMVNHTENLCKTVSESFKQVYVDFKIILGLEGEGCYIPQGDYSFSGWEVNTRLPPPVLEYGNYRTTIELLHDGVRFACVEGIGLVKQKI